MTLYLVHGNTWYEGYGHVESLFGVFDGKDAAERAKEMIRNELYKRECQNEYTNVEDISDIEIDILEIESNRITEILLGGYCE